MFLDLTDCDVPVYINMASRRKRSACFIDRGREGEGGGKEKRKRRWKRERERQRQGQRNNHAQKEIKKEKGVAALENKQGLLRNKILRH